MTETTTTTKDLASSLIKTAITADRKDDKIWTTTGKLIVLEGFGSNDELDAKAMQTEFGKAMESASSEVPLKGEDRKGNEILLRKKDGSIKWSSWKVTARIFQNSAEIFKGIQQLGFDVVFPSDKLISRPVLAQLLKDAKSPESAIETIRKSVDMIEKKLVDCTEDDIEELETLHSRVSVSFMEVSEALKKLKAA